MRILKEGRLCDFRGAHKNTVPDHYSNKSKTGVGLPS